MELGKPVALPNNLGRSSVRSDDGVEGRGISKKRRAVCNELHRAHFPQVNLKSESF